MDPRNKIRHVTGGYLNIWISRKGKQNDNDFDLLLCMSACQWC